MYYLVFLMITFIVIVTFAITEHLYHLYKGHHFFVRKHIRRTNESNRIRLIHSSINVTRCIDVLSIALSAPNINPHELALLEECLVTLYQVEDDIETEYFEMFGCHISQSYRTRSQKLNN